jgi:hypothetical protein
MLQNGILTCRQHYSQPAFPYHRKRPTFPKTQPTCKRRSAASTFPPATNKHSPPANGVVRLPPLTSGTIVNHHSLTTPSPATNTARCIRVAAPPALSNVVTQSRQGMWSQLHTQLSNTRQLSVCVCGWVSCLESTWLKVASTSCEILRFDNNNDNN